MKKLYISLLFIFSVFNLNSAISDETDIYKKIDLFGEVLEKINEEYVEDINQSKSMRKWTNFCFANLFLD